MKELNQRIADLYTVYIREPFRECWNLSDEPDERFMQASRRIDSKNLLKSRAAFDRAPALRY